MQSLTVNEIFNAASQIANKIIRMYEGSGKYITIYGVPRGGIPAAFAVACKSTGLINVVDDVERADVIIDDIEDSGRTREYYKTLYPNKPFMTLYESAGEWLVFPWEDMETHGAEDIPVRLLQFIGEDYRREGLKETPKRFLKAWRHYTSGYEKNAADLLKVFEDGAENYGEMVLVKDIPVWSHCEHHLAPFYGVAHVAYIPNGKIVGLSKLSRLVDMFMRRLQVQERLTNQIADALNKALKPVGVGVVIECQHSCMIARGVQVQGTTTVTSAMHGAFMENPAARAELMSLVK